MSKNPHIKPVHVKKICARISAWRGPTLSWADVIVDATPILGYEPSRSGLSGHPSILEEFQEKNKQLERPKTHREPRPASLAAAAKRIADLEARCAAQHARISQLLDQFRRWQQNASLHRVTKQMLDKPLPRIDRRGTGIDP